MGEFAYNPQLRFTCGAKLVIQTRRGIEIGEHVPFAGDECPQGVGSERIEDWRKACGEESFVRQAGRVLREATAADLAEYTRIQNDCREKCAVGQRLADQHKLPMRVVECECPFGGERIICYFTAAERVDFRGLVKDLAREYRTRIEMRQVGARDEARLLADFETCGREICCKSFLKTLKPISMRMAKLQKSTLDPTQVSGRCGRLKCCLQYENVGYEELDKRLPRNGTRVYTSQGEGVVFNRQVLTQLVQIRTEADVVLTASIEDLLTPEEAKAAAKPRQPAAPPRQPRGRRDKVAEREKPAQARPSVKPARGEPDKAAEVAEPDGNRAEDSKSQPGTPTKRRRRRGRGRRNRKRSSSGNKPGTEGGS